MNYRELENFIDWYRQELTEEGLDVDLDTEAVDIVERYMDRPNQCPD